MKCCSLMRDVLEYAAQRETYPPGLRMHQAFNLTTMKPTRALLIYHLPGRGRGKERKRSETLMVRNCPFCGAETGIAEELAKHAESKPARAKREKGEGK